MALAIKGTVNENQAGILRPRKTATPLIINGDMQIAQRGTSATGLTNGSNGYYTCDRWKWQESGTPSFVVTMSQDTDVPTGQGFSKSLKYDITTADASLASNDGLLLLHNIEGQNLQQLKYGTSSAESVTLCFWVKSNKTGTYVLELYDSDNSKTIAETYTIDSANTWEKKTITLEGNTADSLDNDNNLSIAVSWWLSAGTDFTSGTLNTTWQTNTSANRAVGQTVNLADSTSNYINITGVQLEVGSFDANSIPPFQFEDRGTSLARCQRYYYQVDSGSTTFFASAYLQSSTEARATVQFPVEMRGRPTVVSSSTSNGFQFVSATGNDTCDDLEYPFNSARNKKSALVRNNSVSGFTAGQAGYLRFNQSTPGTLGFDSEL